MGLPCSKPPPPKRVLDVACGASYGRYMMAQALPDSVAIRCDHDRCAVDYAKKSYSAGNLQFFQAELVRSRTNQENSLSSAENLNDGGILLLPTACGRPDNKLNPAWEHHKIECSFRDLDQLLIRFFARVIPPQHPGVRRQRSLSSAVVRCDVST